eukprot:CAMPEP_0206461530 /NCGR_PEP_ID=MMETSP0324_2-20121206/25423_1 /ASSEMBLY_ACC=CAM_ASM_000836 /TAXON_ID=2866 /ORGANISM="Crypthecodinium cohnii, Strain Seligo" /LENGTH=793 /DNA_ID=CAMNT_0053933483 /DNA_START=13 /DNA_END=2394 /DNA_ORIENTATION=-
MSSAEVWSAEGMTQDDLMRKDMCIVVNYMDEVVGHDSKYNCHKFLPGQPRGILHRAFSVILFDSNGKMLLQQRAPTKITFPNVWTNACCSHPLHGMAPREDDSNDEVSKGSHMGVKHAAVRKLGHELGIPAAQLDAKRFKYMLRLHYWAADVGTYGPQAPWGEHEIDHILLYKLNPGEELTLQPNEEEVCATRWVTQAELKEAMNNPDQSWSPWFKILMSNFVNKWWGDLTKTFTTNEYTDFKKIYRFDTPEEYHGGAGHAWPLLTTLATEEAVALQENEGKRRKVVLDAQRGDQARAFTLRGRKDVSSSAEAVKQGGYGKVPTHSTSKLDQLLRPREVFAALRFKFGGLLEDNLKKVCDDPDIAFCTDMLLKVSRSFAAVIQQLPEGLCLDICIFYLVLRALDTVEDDMEFYKGREHVKQEELNTFGEKRLLDVACSIKGVGSGDERTLAEKFGAVSRVYKTLPKKSQEVIMDITNQMGAGMAEYVAADLGQGTVDVAAYDRYCHMVAGLVGEGLSRLFVARGMEADILLGQGERVWPFCDDPAKNPQNLGLANSMGLFLQKCNIIRDYLEDYVDGRAFWPQTVWKKYSTTGDLGEFARPTAHGAGVKLPLKGELGKVAAKGVGYQALLCLNELVADALELVPDCLSYLEHLKTPAVYRFCAIPQVMALATLVACFDNPLLFTGVVKIRKGLTARLIIGTIDGPDAVHWWFQKLSQEISDHVRNGKATGSETDLGQRLLAATTRIEALTLEKAQRCDYQRMSKAVATLGTVATLAAAVAALKYGGRLGRPLR